MNLTFDKELSIEVVRTKRRKTASIKVIDGAVQAIVPDLSNPSKSRSYIVYRLVIRRRGEVLKSAPRYRVNVFARFRAKSI